MAGSYKHIIDKDGNLLSNEDFIEMIENLGDAYEMAEEMYLMIQNLTGGDEKLIQESIDKMYLKLRNTEIEHEPERWHGIENIIFPERKKVLNEIHLELTAENLSTLIPTEDSDLALVRNGYIKGLEKAIEIVKNKIYEQ